MKTIEVNGVEYELVLGVGCGGCDALKTPNGCPFFDFDNDYPCENTSNNGINMILKRINKAEPEYKPKCRHKEPAYLHNEKAESCKITGVINPACAGCEMDEPKPTAQDVMRKITELDPVEFVQWFNVNFDAK